MSYEIIMRQKSIKPLSSATRMTATSSFLYNIIKPLTGRKFLSFPDVTTQKKLDTLVIDLKHLSIKPSEYVQAQINPYLLRYGFKYGFLYTRTAGVRYYNYCLRRGRDLDAPQKLINVLEKRYGRDSHAVNVLPPELIISLQKCYTQLIQYCVSGNTMPEDFLKIYKDEFDNKFFELLKREAEFPSDKFTELVTMKRDLAARYGNDKIVLACLTIGETLNGR